MITRVCVPGGTVVAEWEGPAPHVGEAVEVWHRSPQARGDPVNEVTRGTVRSREWVVGGPPFDTDSPQSVCLVHLEDVQEP